MLTARLLLPSLLGLVPQLHVFAARTVSVDIYRAYDPIPQPPARSLFLVRLGNALLWTWLTIAQAVTLVVLYDGAWPVIRGWF